MPSPLASTAITYDGLPISGGGAHSLGRMSRRAAYAATLAFLEACTQPVAKSEYTLTVHDVPELPRPVSLEADLERRFGRGRILVLCPDEVSEALDFLDEIHPQPTNQWGMAPIWFRATARFRLLDPATGTVLPGQTGALEERVGYRNEVRLILDNSARIGMSLCIPGGDTSLLDRLLPALQEHAPCKLSRKQWRSWTPTKTGTLKSRVLDVSAFL